MKYPNCRVAPALCAAVLLSAASAAAAERTICYKVTSNMWDPSAQNAVPTSPEMLARVRRAFGLWEEASGGVLSFRDDGFSEPGYDSPNQMPFDGCVHVALYGRRNFHGELAHAHYNGSIPDDFKRGYVFLSPLRDAQAASVIVHEIGHALGLDHSATCASAVFGGERAWGRGEPARLSEQDGADLRARWAPDTSKVYTISGKIETAGKYQNAFIFAANVRNGRTYSCRADHMGRFSVAIAEPGEYKLAAKAAEVSGDLLPAARIGKSLAWYVSDGDNEELADRAAIFGLSSVSRDIKGLRFRTIDKAPPFHLTWAQVRGRALLYSLGPGDEVVLDFPEARGALASVEPFGSSPDYSFEPVPGPGGRGVVYKLKISPTAEPGERLVVARSLDGRTTAGLVGINISAAAAPHAEAVPRAQETALPGGAAAASPSIIPPAPAAPRGVMLHLTFDSGLNDEGPYRGKVSINGDEVRIVPGRRGQALFIGGTKDWVDVAVDSTTPLAGGYAIELWVKRDDWENPYKGGSGWQTVAALGGGASVSITAPGCPLHKPWALQGSASRYRSDVKENEHSEVLSAPGSVVPERWTHAALVYDQAGGYISLYQDGKRVDTAYGAPGPDFGWGFMRLGTWHQDNQAFRGEIDDVVVYNYPRSDEEIAAAASR